jgi:hypothetical protein
LEVTGGTAVFDLDELGSQLEPAQAQTSDNTHLHVFFGTPISPILIAPVGPAGASTPVRPCGDTVVLNFSPSVPARSHDLRRTCPGSLGLNTMFLGSDFTDNHGMEHVRYS